MASYKATVTFHVEASDGEDAYEEVLIAMKRQNFSDCDIEEIDEEEE